MHYGGGSHLQHHGFPESGPPAVDDALLEELHLHGAIDIDYREHTWLLTPTAQARELVAAHDRLMNEEPAADLQPLLEAVDTQAQASNKLGWAAVRPVLAALRDYWEAGGFSSHGIQLVAVVKPLPEKHEAMFVATIRAFIKGGYLDTTTDLFISDLPGAVVLTERAHTVLDGWPGASPDELVNNLLAVLTAAAAEEPDPARKRRLEKFAETVKDVGVSTAGEVLAKVLVGA